MLAIINTKITYPIVGTTVFLNYILFAVEQLP